MDWYLVCFVDEAGTLCGLHAPDSARAVPLYLHLDKCTGLQLAEALGEVAENGTFLFEEGQYHAVTVENKMGWGSLVFISDAPVRAHLYETVLNRLPLGLEIFDTHGRLVFLNDTCRRVESLIKQNVLGKHLREIYTVDESYSTMLTTIREKRPVLDRCDLFENRFGNPVVSINNGYPLYVDGRFFGALGVVLDLDGLSMFAGQHKILSEYVKQHRGKDSGKYHLSGYHRFADIVGDAPAMRAAVDVARKAAPTDFSVLLLGETGTGKEMFAQSIHTASGRRAKAFVAINCAAIPASIMESTLFGTVKGSFTGAGNQNGLLDEADGGTLFLDEINSMDLQLQAKLLRVLQEKNFKRVGGLRDIACDFRVVAAMNEPPAQAMAQGRLRGDLYYRLNTITVDIPPLREHREDIPVLARRHLERVQRMSGSPLGALTSRALAMLEGYDWPGNIRELLHALDHAVAMAEGGPIDAACFPRRFTLASARPGGECQKYLHYDFHKRLQETERQMLTEALSACGGNVSRAAKALGLSRQNLQHRLKKNGIQPHGGVGERK